MSAPLIITSDLAPGDLRAAEFDWEHFQVHRIKSSADPKFDVAYEHLRNEFGGKHEIEQKDILSRRFEWSPHDPQDGYALYYEMILVEHLGKFAGVRDHAVILPLDAAEPAAIVHLSHLLIAPEWRGKGLAGWMRAWPIQTARACLRMRGQNNEVPITLVGEMEHPLKQQPDRMMRLRAYERAGFKKVDPHVVDYLQPDFRIISDIENSGGPRPLPMALIIRRVKRENVDTITATELRLMVGALYGMYAVDFKQQDMQGMMRRIEQQLAKHTQVQLVAPTSE